MSYSFDYNNARFVIVDPWVTPSVDISAGGIRLRLLDHAAAAVDQQPARQDHARHRPCLRDVPPAPHGGEPPGHHVPGLHQRQSGHAECLLRQPAEQQRQVLPGRPRPHEPALDHRQPRRTVERARAHRRLGQQQVLHAQGRHGRELVRAEGARDPGGPGAVHGRLLHLHGGWTERDGGLLLRQPRQLAVGRQLPARGRPS